MDVVLFEGMVEYPCEGRVEDCGCEGEGDGEEGGDGGDDGCGEGSQAGEEGGKTDEDFGAGGDEGDNVGYIHPFGGGLIGFESIFEFLADEIVGGGVVQVPDLDGVEPKLFLPRRAFCDVVGYTASGVLLEIARAVVP